MNPLQSLSSESLLEQGTSLVKKTAQMVGQQTQTTVQTAVSQVTGLPMATPSDGGTPMQPIQRDKQTADFVKDLYGSNQQSAHPKLPSVHDQPPEVKKQQEKSSTDQKLADTRQRLAQLLQSQHTSSYYDPTFNRPKQQEESKVEELERKDRMEEFEKQEKEKKKPAPLAVQMGSNKAERFPGASG